MRYIIYDGETHSTVSLRRHGSHIYTCDPTTDVWCVSYCIVTEGVRGPTRTWLPPDPAPADILAAAADLDTKIGAFNDAFERQLEERILHPRYGWPLFPIERRFCAQAIALTHALPAALDSVAAALQLPVRKTAAGKRAMKQLALPRKPRKDEDPDKIYWHGDPNLLEAGYEYNRIDVEITAEIVARLGFIAPREQEVWQIDAGINARGICCDVELLDAALNIAEEASTDLRDKLAALTDGEITSPAQTARILKWLSQHGCEVPNVQGETLLEALKRSNLAPAARQLIGLRLDGAHAAVDKFDTLRRWLGPDHRIRHVYRYHGAMPGRFTSVGAQMQNLKKPTVEDVAAAIEVVRSGSLARMRARYERPLAIVGDITRGLIVPAPGHRLFIADLSGIESRGLARLCNEQSKLEAWREFDRTGDLTKEPYYRFGVEDLHLEGGSARGTGKLSDLAFGYQGALGAWRRMAPAGDNTPDEKVYAYRRAWVRRHPNIEKFWSTSVRQAVNAIESKDGERFTVARIAFQREGHFLYMELPSGRRLSYPFARIYAGEHGKTFTFRDASGGRWEWYHVLKRRGAFGGLIAENATQALCRDIFVEAMLRLEAAGYHIVAHLHDEFVCEVPEGFGDLDEFRAIITTPPAWAPDFAIATKARIADRFIETKEPKTNTSTPAETSIHGNDEAEPEIDIDDADEPQPVTQRNIDEINAGLVHEGIEPPHINAAPESTIPPPGANMPPRDFDDPSPRDNGQDTGHDAGNGFDNQYAAGEQPHGTPTARYVYKDARGLLFMRVIRTNSGAQRKSFPTQHWEDGRWVSGWPPSPVIPYRLPELLAAPATEPVWICEGEKDADNVAALGLNATTNPGGAKVWQPELAQWFKDRQLAYILEDNDDAGRMHTRKILAALTGIVPSITVISFPELPEKGDVSDWFEAGGNKKLLLARAEQARQRAEARRSYTLIELHTLPLEATDWLWEGHLIRGELELLAGRPGVGKTQVQCQYMVTITAGRPWPDGQQGPLPGNVILITAEDKAQDYHKRLIAAGADLTRIKVLKYVRRNDRDEMFLLSQDLDKLEQAIIDLGNVSLIAIDPITAFMGAGKHFDSHRTTDVRAQLGPLALLAEKLNVAFSAVTHPPKNASQRALDHFIGSQAYIAVARVGHICVDEMEEIDGERRPSGRMLFAHPKGNFSAQISTLAYRIEAVRLGWDAKRERDIITSVVRWEGPVDITADEAVTTSKPVKRKNRSYSAREFLLDLLAGGPALQKVVVERGAERGFSYDQLRRAKRVLGVVAYKRRGERLDSPWLWALPQHVPQGAEPEADEAPEDGA